VFLFYRPEIFTKYLVMFAVSNVVFIFELLHIHVKL